jgi:hypothetical protein
MHLLVERFSFGDIDQGSLKEGAKTYLMAQMSPLILLTR